MEDAHEDPQEKALPAPQEAPGAHLLQGSDLEPVEVSQLLEAFFRRHGEHTRRAYRKDLELFGAWIGVQNMEELAKKLLGLPHGRANLVADEWRAHLVANGYAPNTVNRRLAAIRSVVDLARVLGIVSWSLEVKNVPVENYRDTKGPGVDTIKEMLTVLNGDEDNKVTRRARALVHVLFGMALRRGEAVALNVEDVDFKGDRIWVMGKKRTQKAPVTMPKNVAKALDQWLDLRGRHGGPLFVNFDPAGKGDGRLSGESANRIVKQLGRRAGAKVRCHGIRHTAITDALDKLQGDVRSVQQFSRHKRMETVGLYDDKRKDLGGQVAEAVDGELDDTWEDSNE